MSDYNVGKLTFDLDVNKTKFSAGLRASELEAAASATKTRSKIKGIGDESDRAAKSVNGLSGSFRGLGTAMVAAVGGMFVIDQMKQMVMGASDLNEALNMNKLTFEAGAPAMQEWAEGMENLGLTTTEALNAASRMGGMFLNLGLDMESASSQAKTLVELAADMKSGFGGSVLDAIQAISSGLRGETEPLRRYNVTLDDMLLKEKAREMQLYSGKGALTQVARAQAAYALILEQTSRVQGDFLATADDPANSLEQLRAKVGNLKNELGEELLPVFRDLLNTSKDIVTWAKENTELIKTVFELSLKIGLVVAAMKAWKAINTALIGSNAAVAASATTMGAAMQANLAGIVAGAGKAIGVMTALEVLTRGISAGFDADRNAEFIRMWSEANPEYNGDVPWWVPAQAGYNNLRSGIPIIGEISGASEIFREVDKRLADEAAKEAELDAMKTMRETIAETEKLLGAQGDLTEGQDEYTRALERHNKAQDDAKAAMQAYRDALSATKADVLGAVPAFGGMPGADGLANANAQVSSARTALAEAEAELARVSRYHQAGSQTVADARTAVSEATQALAEANTAADEARGMSQADLLKRSAETREYLRQQARDVKALRAAELSDDAVSALLDLEKSAPGTMRRVVEEGISKPFVEQLNKDFEKRNAAADVIARQLNEALRLGVKKAKAAMPSYAMEFHRAWLDAMGYKASASGEYGPPDGVLSGPRQSSQGYTPLLPGSGTTNQYNINGEVRIEANDPEGLWEGVRRRARLDALGGR